MNNKSKALTIAAALQVLCAGLLLSTPAAADCASDRSSCASGCASTKSWADTRAGHTESLAIISDDEAGKAEAAAARSEAREEYRICLNNCDAQYNACERDRVREDYDD